MSRLLLQIWLPRMSLQSLGVSHMKLGALTVALFRSLTMVQSIAAPQLLGLASTSLLQRLVLFVMSWKTMNGLWMLLYGSGLFSAPLHDPGVTVMFSK